MTLSGSSVCLVITLTAIRWWTPRLYECPATSKDSLPSSRGVDVVVLIDTPSRYRFHLTPGQVWVLDSRVGFLLAYPRVLRRHVYDEREAGGGGERLAVSPSCSPLGFRPLTRQLINSAAVRAVTYGVDLGPLPAFTSPILTESA